MKSPMPCNGLLGHEPQIPPLRPIGRDESSGRLPAGVRQQHPKSTCERESSTTTLDAATGHLAP
jgi:hypothetical protein